jgi:iron(III) transport system ATP-binding protein/putative spermidine/putrescine transport system ATP-binding protein/spermidine/putrescine transport system ATP-binding protein
MLRLDSLTKRFGDTTAVADLSLEVRDGEFLSLLGPSGCGKTTTLRMIAGFERPTSGRILLDDRDVTPLDPRRRGMGMVFQSYALFPHLDVFENVAFGLKTRRVPSAEIPARVERALERVDLAGYSRRSVQALSGGQQQRVALARALAPEPPVLLLDEPLSNLDAALRERTRAELRAVLKQVGITSIFVTHDQEEAFELSDRIAVLEGGRLQQVGVPDELYREPANAFVAAFVGRANFLPGRLIAASGGVATCEIAGRASWAVRSADGLSSGPVSVMVRPESLVLSPAGSGAPDRLPARVLDRRFAGAVTYYRLEAEGVGQLLAAIAGIDPGLPEAVEVGLAPDAVAHAFPASER